MGWNHGNSSRGQQRRPAVTPPPHVHGNMSSPTSTGSVSSSPEKSSSPKNGRVQKSTNLTPKVEKMTTRGVKVKTYAESDSDK